VNWGQVETRVLLNLGKYTPPDANCILQLPMWAEEFQRDVQRDRNYWFLKLTATRLIDQTAQTYEQPPGYKDGLLLYREDDINDEWIEMFPLSNTDKIRLFSPSQLAGDKAPPLYYEFNSQSWTMWPWPDQQYLLRCEYWGDLTIPSPTPASGFLTSPITDPQTNYWTQYFPDLYINWLTMLGFNYLQEYSARDEQKEAIEKTISDLRAQNVARVIGSGNIIRPRTDMYGTNYDSRSVGWQVYYW
jgi:hypothetical protein